MAVADSGKKEGRFNVVSSAGVPVGGEVVVEGGGDVVFVLRGIDMGAACDNGTG